MADNFKFHWFTNKTRDYSRLWWVEGLPLNSTLTVFHEVLHIFYHAWPAKSKANQVQDLVSTEVTHFIVKTRKNSTPLGTRQMLLCINHSLPVKETIS